MTEAVLLWFDCKRCGKPFMSYVKAKIFYTDGELTIMSKEYGDVSNNSYIYSIKNSRECHKHYGQSDIQSFISGGVDS